MKKIMAEFRKEEKVLAEAGATVYIRGSRAYADLGGALIRLDTTEGLKEDQELDVIIKEREP